MARHRTGFCNHYRAMSEHTSCEAGVSYETLKGVPHDARPCFVRNGKPGSHPCPLAKYPTAEELAKRDAEFAKRFEGTMKAREAIVEACGGPWKKGKPGASGTIDCPVCNGVKTLRFSRAGYNGHVHASCKTADCVSWME